MARLTNSTKPLTGKQIVREWLLVDVDGKVLGRAATEIAKVLQGKHKALYTPNLDSGDYVVVVNAKRVTLTGKKRQTKEYQRYSGYPGGLKRISFSKMIENRPEEVVRHAVSGMLPKNKLRAKRLARLYIFPDQDHPYQTKFKKQ